MSTEGGGVIGVAILLQDVTRLMRFDELKNNLVATVAHEFRTPLTSLRMALHLCLEQVVGPITEKQADLLYVARQDTERLQQIVDDLLDLSRIQSGRIELHQRPVDAATLARDAAQAFRAPAEAKGIELRLELLPSLGTVVADPERIELAFANLVGNAVKYTPAGGRIAISAARRDGAVRYAVTDNGPGVPPELRQAIFEKFFRRPGATTPGAGLGLFIAKEIVEAHGGKIGVEGSPGHGQHVLVRAAGCGGVRAFRTLDATSTSPSTTTATPHSYRFRFRHSVDVSIFRISAASSSVAVRPVTRRMCSRSMSSSAKSPPTNGRTGNRLATRSGKASREMHVGRPEDRRALDRVAQLAHVAGPAIATASAPRPPSTARAPGARAAGGEERQEAPRQAQDVLGPLAQRRHADLDDVEPVEQILAEVAGLDVGLDVAVGGGDDADVGGARLASRRRARTACPAESAAAWPAARPASRRSRRGTACRRRRRRRARADP